MLLDGTAISSIPSKEVAKVMGLLPQTPIAPEGITVADLVGRGRYPHQGWFRQWSADDDRAVAEALTATSTLDLADRPIEEMSGGQRQRVWIAMALAQETDLLLLDEPTTYLDLSHQLEVLDLLTDLNRRRGTTIVLVMHDLNLACRYADHLIAMRDGRISAEGTPNEVVTAELDAWRCSGCAPRSSPTRCRRPLRSSRSVDITAPRRRATVTRSPWSPASGRARR